MWPQLCPTCCVTLGLSLSSAKRSASGRPRPLPQLPCATPGNAVEEEELLRSPLPPARGLGSGAARALPSRTLGVSGAVLGSVRGT